MLAEEIRNSMENDKDDHFMLMVLFVALAFILVALYIDNEASKAAHQCIENGGQWVQMTKNSFACITPK